MRIIKEIVEKIFEKIKVSMEFKFEFLRYQLDVINYVLIEL